ncbi:hypothetical protein GCM10007864_18330 [Sinorhizobium fredii]|nr:hypothetical protein GCM10007864_18330 [Sinorhizobium fredii]
MPPSTRCWPDAAIEAANTPGPARDREKDHLDWDEDERLEEWRAVIRQAENLPAVLQAVALNAWNELAVRQHAPLARPAAVRIDPAPGRRHRCLRSISVSKAFSPIGAGIAIAQPGCSPSPKD